MKAINRKVFEILNNGKPLVLVTIIRHIGSTPRSTGAKMIVASDGTTFGSVGGGKIEAMVISFAREIFTTRRHRLMDFKSGEEAVDSLGEADMVCGGGVTMLLEYLAPDKALVDLLAQMMRCGEKGERIIQAIFLGPGDSVGEHISRIALVKDRILGMTHPFPRESIARIVDAAEATRKPFLTDIGERRFFIEPPFVTGDLVLAGAGHVAREVVMLASRVDFKITVVDDREDFADKKFFPDADAVIRLEGFHHPFDALTIDKESFILIMTRGHQYDKMVLANALRTGAGYIGMMGSSKKREAIYGALAKHGFSENDFRRVHCPVGLSIHAQTPAEIAVSVVAQLIEKRAELFH